MIGYIDSSSFPVYTYGEIVMNERLSDYYIYWTPSNIGSGRFYMEGNTYYYTTHLGSFSFSGGIITESAFMYSPGCSKLTTIVTNAYEIDAYAFYSCSNISTLTANMCNVIRERAFQGCYSLKYLYLPLCDTLLTDAFANCSSLSQANLPYCEFLDIGVFDNCRTLSQVSLPKCTYIGSEAFAMCFSLSQLNLPVCSYIGDNTFYRCSALNTITLGSRSVCELGGSYVFDSAGITSSTGSIYVPASLVSRYKSAQFWSQYSTIIYPINN